MILERGFLLQLNHLEAPLRGSNYAVAQAVFLRRVP
jgi:hypothetical protein